MFIYWNVQQTTSRQNLYCSDSAGFVRPGSCSNRHDVHHLLDYVYLSQSSYFLIFTEYSRGLTLKTGLAMIGALLHLRTLVRTQNYLFSFNVPWKQRTPINFTCAIINFNKTFKHYQNACMKQDQNNLSLMRQKGESQNGGNKKTKRAEFYAKRIFLTP